MESSSSKVEAMKPVLLKAGIPLAVSLAGFVLARIATRKSSVFTASSQIQAENVEEREYSDTCSDQESFQRLGLECLPRDNDDHAYADEILGLRRRVEDMQDRELQLEKRFLYYQGLKDKEVALMDLHNKMMLEMNRAEFLEREVSLVQAENQRFENGCKEYLKILRLDEFLRLENEQLCKKVKKLLRRNREHSWILRKQCLQIQCKETEISRNKSELGKKDDCISLMQDEIKEMKFIIEQFQVEKNEVLCKLKSAEKSSASNKEEGEKHEASEVREVIYLRWSNACLKHELMRRSQEHTEEIKDTDNAFGGTDEFGSDNELNQRAVEQDDSYLGLTARDHAHAHAHARSKRRRLIAKFKRWVEGSDKTKPNSLDEKEKYGNKCFPRHSVSDGAEDAYLLARKSCSSV